MPRTPNEGSIVKDVPSWRHYDIGMNPRTTVRRHAAVDESAETYSGGFAEGRLLDGSAPALVRCALGQAAERRRTTATVVLFCGKMNSAPMHRTRVPASKRAELRALVGICRRHSYTNNGLTTKSDTRKMSRIGTAARGGSDEVIASTPEHAGIHRGAFTPF